MNSTEEKFEAVDIPASIQDRLNGAAFHIANAYQAERADVEQRLRFALIHGDATYDPSFGMSRDAYLRLCLNNAIHHLCRALEPRAAEARVTDHLDDIVRGEWTLGDAIGDRRTGPEKLHRTLAIREWLDQLTGLPWLVAIATLCGLRFSEIARKVGIPRTSFDRKFAPIFASLKTEEVAHVA